MSALADLFSADSPPPSPGAPSRPRGEALFLSPGSTPSGTPAKRRRTYDDSDDDDDDLAEEYAKVQAEKRRLAERARLSRETGAERLDALGEDGVRALDELLEEPAAPRDAFDIGDDEVVKKKRTLAKIDAERLMGHWGLPALLGAAKQFKVKGKGHETKDLRRLLDVYQMWAHGMFPKGNFAYTIGRAEVVCRTGRMQSAISGLRDAFDRERNGEVLYEPEDLRDDEIEGEVHGGGEVQPGVWVEGDDIDEADPFASAQDVRRQPLFDPHDDGPDDDEMLAMQEMEGGLGGDWDEETHGKATPPKSKPTALFDAHDDPDDPDMDELLAMEEMDRGSPRGPAPEDTDNIDDMEW